MPSPTEHYKESAEYRELCRQFEICSENVDIIDRQIALSMLGKFVSYLKRPRRDLDLDILRCWFETAKQFFHSRRELYEARCSTNHPGAPDSGEERTKRVPQLEEKIANFAAELWKDATPVQNIALERPDLERFSKQIGTIIWSHLPSRSVVAAPAEVGSVLGNGSQEDHASRVSDQAASTHGDSQVGSMAPQSPAGETSQQQAIQNTEPHKTTDGGTGGGKVTIPPRVLFWRGIALK